MKLSGATWVLWITAVRGALRPYLPAQPIFNTTSSLKHFGHPDGFTFPMVAGEHGDGVLLQGSFGTNIAALLTFNTNGQGLIDTVDTISTSKVFGVQQLNDSASIEFLGFGDSSLAADTGDTSIILAFVATARSLDNGQCFDGIFIQERGKGVVALATTEQAFGPAGGTFRGFSSPAISVSASASKTYITFQAQAANWQGIVLAELETSKLDYAQPALSVVADSNTIIPGTTDLSFRCLGQQVVSAAGDVVFFGSHCEESVVSSIVSAQSAHRVFFRTKRTEGHCLRKRLAYSNNVFPGIFQWSRQHGLTVVADANTRVPGGSDSATFVGFSDPAISADATAAFVAESTDGVLGVYAHRAGRLEEIATTSTEAPGTGGQLFGDFPFVPTVSSNGEVIFYSSVAGSYSGIYSGTTSAIYGSSSIRTELTLADAVGGKSLIYIGFGTSACSQSANVCAAYLVLGDGVDGVWTWNRTPASINDITAAVPLILV